MSQLAGAAFVASGDINVCRFVSLSGNFAVQQAGANDAALIGISQDGSHRAPGVAGSDALAAANGETLKVFGPGDVCLLKVTAAVTAGAFLKPDTNGQGVALALGTTQYIGAKALESANAGELCRVVVIIGAAT